MERVTQMALRFKLQFVFVADDDQQVSVDEVVVLDKDYERLEQLGPNTPDANRRRKTPPAGVHSSPRVLPSDTDCTAA